MRCAIILPARDPGVAKFGIALEWGSRGRWFESSHSDQEKVLKSYDFRAFSLFYKEKQGKTVEFRANTQKFSLIFSLIRMTYFPTFSINACILFALSRRIASVK